MKNEILLIINYANRGVNQQFMYNNNVSYWLFTQTICFISRKMFSHVWAPLQNDANDYDSAAIYPKTHI